jgi:hypothetical protein
MIFRFRIPPQLAWAIPPACFLLLAGCNNILVPKHRVLVDAISAPGVVIKASGTSYRLLAKKSTVTNVPAQVAVIKACVDAALAGKGMYEPPANVAPELFIEVAYGVDVTPRVDAAARETFLQLSARANPTKAVDRGTGPELWDVRVSVLGVAGRIETAMPLLAAVASDYIGTDTKLETRIEIPQNSAAIGSVRQNAIKTLEGQAAVNPNDPAAPGAAAAAKAAVKPVTTR